ncbi:hypothetical protein ABIA87_009135 [Bradyrhizobium sp. LA6.3]
MIVDIQNPRCVIAKPSTEPVRVTDHAVLRYMERAMGLNVEIVRAHILQICADAAAFGAVCVRSEGFRFEIASGAVVTVTSDQQSPGATTRERAQDKIDRAKGR